MNPGRLGLMAVEPKTQTEARTERLSAKLWGPGDPGLAVVPIRVRACSSRRGK